jgi:hypothetical protein
MEVKFGLKSIKEWNIYEFINIPGKFYKFINYELDTIYIINLIF